MSANVYAIIGRGYAAALNFATLLLTDSGRRRLGDREVVFVGGPDPWAAYDNHLMGQPATLLGLPGFMDQPEGANFLSSERFASITQLHHESFEKHRGRVRYQNTRLEAIVPHTDGYFKLLMLGDDSLDADYVDLCIGPGTAVTDSIGMGEETVKELADSRRLFTGFDFLRKDLSVRPGMRICVIGTGAVGSLCCERALDRERFGAKSVSWIARSDFEGAIPEGGRFDGLAEPTGDAVNVDTTIPHNFGFPGVPKPAEKKPIDMRPKHHNLYIFNRFSVQSVRTDQSNIRIQLSQLDKFSRCIDQSGNRTIISEIPADIIVVAAGPKSTVRSLLPKRQSLEPINSPILKIPVGLQAFKGKVRILGAAALNEERFLDYLKAGAQNTAMSLMRQYVDSLSVHIKVPENKPNLSIPVAARFIAEANCYFKEYVGTCGPNWNCVLRPHLEECLATNGWTLSTPEIEKIFSDRKYDVLSQPPACAPHFGDSVYSKHASYAYLRDKDG